MGDLRVGSFQAGLTRAEPGELLEELSEPGSEQAQQVAEAVQQVRPDVLLLSGIDVDEGLQVAAALKTNYLSIGSAHTAGIDYPHVYVAPVNAGVDTGADLDDDGMSGGPGDSFGYGEFPGQAGMMILSRVPLETDQARTFQDFKWQDMPGSALPTEQFTELEASVLRLSSTSHWDVPVSVGGRTVHLLASAPADPQTAPAGAERNHDEVRFWADYIAGAGYPVDDDGRAGGLEASSDFVVLGSLGADPATDTGADPAAIGHLTDLSHVQDTHPTSSGALLSQTPEDTAVVQDAQGEPTTARVDYVLPSSTLTASNSGVFCPAAGALRCHRPPSGLGGHHPGPLSGLAAVRSRRALAPQQPLQVGAAEDSVRVHPVPHPQGVGEPRVTLRQLGRPECVHLPPVRPPAELAEQPFHRLEVRLMLVGEELMHREVHAR